MKGFTKFFVLTALVAIFAVGAFAQSSTQATATASVEIVEALEITKVADLHFGTVSLPDDANAGTVAVDASSGTRTTSANVQPIAGGGETRAEFTVTGAAGNTFAVTLDPSVELTATAGELTATLASSCDSACALGTIYVGGELTIAAAYNTTGAFTSPTPFDISVAYE